MKRIWLILALFQTIHVYAQKVTYIVFEDRPLFEDVEVAPFKLRYTDVKLQDTARAKKTLHIYNLYYSCNNFNAPGIDKKAFVAGAADYRQFHNDVLVTLTPLTDSLENKLVKISRTDLINAGYLTTEQLLQKVITNLYKEFIKDEISNYGKEGGQLKNMQYKLLIKRGKDYYAFNGPVLTEYYLVNYALYLFPNQYHYSEINTAPVSKIPYFDRKAIAEIEKKFPSTNNNNNFPRELLNGRVYPGRNSVVSSLYYTRYNTYPKRYGGFSFVWQKNKIFDGAAGVGTFDFSEGTGIINGSFDFYVNHYKSAVEEENSTISPGVMHYIPVTLNHVSINDYSKAYQKKHPPKLNIEL
jgi:hypothetical protein